MAELNHTPIPGEQENNRNPDGTFKPGMSGNPSGRPTGSFSIMTIIRKKMEEIPVGQVKEWKYQIAGILLEEAVVKKNMKALEMIVEYMDGKPKQTIDLDVNKENVDSLTDLLREMGKTKQNGPDTATPTPPSSEPGSDAGGSQG